MMTIEEVIKDLELIKAEAEWEFPINWQVSLDIAIEILKQTNIDNLSGINLKMDKSEDITPEKDK